MISPIEQYIFERRLADLRKALAENEARLFAAPPHSHAYRNYLRQELESERCELSAEMHRTEAKLASADAKARRLFRLFKRREEPDPETARQIATLEFADQERRPQTDAFVRKLEQQGDHRSARMHRFQLIRLREQVARECGFL